MGPVIIFWFLLNLVLDFIMLANLYFKHFTFKNIFRSKNAAGRRDTPNINVLHRYKCSLP